MTNVKTKYLHVIYTFNAQFILSRLPPHKMFKILPLLNPQQDLSLFTFNEAIIDNFPILQSSAVADQEIC